MCNRTPIYYNKIIIDCTFRRQFAADTLIDVETSVVIHEDLNAPRNRTIAAWARRNRRAILTFLIVLIITIIVVIVVSLATGENGNETEKTIATADEMIPA